MLEALSERLSTGAPDALAALRALFLCACALLAWRACFHFAPYRIGHRPKLFLFPLLFLAALAAILIYQATWQLAGFRRSEFVRFMERHNPRADNAANRIIRSSLLDRNGAVLAFTETNGTGRRVYPYAEATAHVVGFRHPSEGLTGMEGAADATLSGWGELRTAADVREAGLVAMQRERRVGTNVTLCIDARLQLRATSALRGRRGAAVALDPRTGEVLLLASSPAFDPNRFERRLNVAPDSPLLNRALHGRYPSGSTFKTAVAGLMVDCGVAQEIDCPGEGYRPGGRGRPIRDHEYYAWEKRGAVWPGFGRIGLDKALAKSSNVYFAKAGDACGTESFNGLAARLLMNERIPLYSNGVRRVSSREGNVPRLGRGERRELTQLSIGQGRLLATPLHLALLAASIADGGTMMAPRLALDDPPAVLSQPFSRRAADRVARAMRGVVASGTAHAIAIPGLDIGAKTGTAQNPGGEDHAWFICFAGPTGGAPEIAVSVVVENAGFGSAAALPVARQILEAWALGRGLLPSDASRPPR